MKRILAIDYGKKRIGISISDPLKIIANSVGTFANDENFFQNFSELLKKYEVEKILVGFPKNLKGEKTEISFEVEKFADELKKNFLGEIILYDERFTSVYAQKIIVETISKKSERRNKSLIDKIAASILLQNYLDNNEKN